MIKSDISRWDAVDINFARGDKRFGYVVDIQGNNVVVDCGNGTPLTVSCQQVLPPPDKEAAYHALLAGLYRDYTNRGQPDSWNAFDMEAVLQLSPQEPFRWFPARPLRLLHPDYRLVEVQLSNERIRCVLPSDHIRQPDCRIKGGNILPDIAKERVQVPAGFVLSERAHRLWRKGFYRYKIVDVRDEYLYYLKGKDRWPRDESEAMKKFFEEATDCSKSEAPTLSDIVMVNEPASLPSIHEILPAEVMLKIFKLLDTEHQASARRVCKQWNMWLHLPEIVTVVRIDCSKEFGLERFRVAGDVDRGRRVAACLFHCLRPDTKKLVLTGFQMWQVLGTLDQLTDFAAIRRVPEVVLAGMEEDFDCFSEEAHIKAGVAGHDDSRQLTNIFGIHPTLRRVCQWLVLDNVTIKNVNCSFAFTGNRRYAFGLPEILDIKGVSARINLQSSGCAADLWNAMEPYCPVVSDASRLLIADALHKAGKEDCQSTEEREKRARVGMMLYGFETSDPRNQHLPLRKFEEPVNWSAVRVENLNKMTLFMLNYILTDCHGSDKDESDPDQSPTEHMDDYGEPHDDVEPDAE